MSASILTNKHFVVALIVSPILAVLAWFAVDKIVAPRPEAAKEGASYPLVAKSNCRYASGRCALSNGDVKFLLKKVQDTPSDGIKLELHCEDKLACQFARLELLDENHTSLQSLVLSPQQQAPLTSDLKRATVLRFAARLEGSLYYAETGVDFLKQ